MSTLHGLLVRLLLPVAHMLLSSKGRQVRGTLCVESRVYGLGFRVWSLV